MVVVEEVEGESPDEGERLKIKLVGQDHLPSRVVPSRGDLPPYFRGAI